MVLFVFGGVVLSLASSFLTIHALITSCDQIPRGTLCRPPELSLGVALSSLALCLVRSNCLSLLGLRILNSQDPGFLPPVPRAGNYLQEVSLGNYRAYLVCFSFLSSAVLSCLLLSNNYLSKIYFVFLRIDNLSQESESGLRYSTLARNRSPIVVLFFFLSLFILRERRSMGVGEGQRERILGRLHTVRREREWGSNPRTMRSWPEPDA